MQAQAGVVIPMILPQALSAPPSYHDNQVQTAPVDTMATISVATQIEEAHSTTNNGQGCAPQTEDDGGEDKKAIYRHPLFPLMALLLEKCEQATQTPECPSSDSFDVDIQAFVHRQEQERRPFFSDDLELDGLMVKAIQVLRIHLLELEKVSELCKDFCTRYITCLKGKLQSENLLRTEIPGYDGDTDDCLLSPGRVPAMNANNNNNVQLVQNSNGNVVLQGSVAPPPAPLPVGGVGQGHVVSGGTVYQMVQTPQGLVAQPIQIQSPTPGGGPQTPNTPVLHGSTPLSQIGLQNTPEVPAQHSPTTPSLPKDFNFDDDDYGKRKSKRGILPKQATQVMKSWLFQHIVHPYPTEDEKRQIAGQTNLTMLQVNNWFINARRRILQPMLDASNPEGVKAKKTKPQQTRPVQRFWPENLANYQLQSGSNSANQLPDSPSSSVSPSCSSSPQLTLQVSLEEDEELEDEEEEDEEDDETLTATMSSSYPLASSHPQSTMGPQIIVQSDGTLHNILASNSHQPSSLVSSTSPASSLSLIADAAISGIHQNTNFLPYIGSHQPPSNLANVVSALASHDGREGAGLKPDNRPELVEASSMTH